MVVPTPGIFGKISRTEVFKKFPFLIYFNDTPLQPLFANPFYLNIIITNFNQSDYRLNTQIKSLFPELDIKNELVSLSVNESPFDGVNKNVMQNTMKKIANFNLKNIKLKFNGPEIIICKRLCSQGVLKLNGQKYVFAHDLYRDWSQLQLFLSELYRLEDGSIDLTNFLKSTKRLPLIQHYIVMYFNLFVEKYDCLNNHQFKQQYLRNPNDRINFTLTILNLINGVPIHAMDKRFKRGDKNEILLDNLKIVDDDPRASVIASILRSLELSERPLSSFFYNALHQIFSNPLETLSREKYQEILARYNETSYGYEYEFSEAADNIVATCKLKPRVIKTSLTEVQLPYERFKKYFLSEAIDHFQQRHKSKSNLEDILNSYNSTKKFALRPFVPPEFGKKYEQYKKFKLFDRNCKRKGFRKCS